MQVVLFLKEWMLAEVLCTSTKTDYKYVVSMYI